MRFIEEVVVEEFLPTVRSMLAEALRDRGLTQREVADALGISQSAVSKYAHAGVERNDRILGDERVVEAVDRVADGLAEGGMRPVQALIELEVLIRELERGGVLAELHAEAVPALTEHDRPFDVHDPDSPARTAERTLASVRRGLRTIETTRGIADLLPNVGANLVEARPDATGIADVAGIPGRIFAVQGRPTVPSDPAFGASEHVASVVLAARAAGHDARGAMNVRYAPELVEALRSIGHQPAAFDADYDDLEGAIGRALAETPGATVLYHTGAFGIEPIVYVLAPTAAAAAERVRELAGTV